MSDSGLPPARRLWERVDSERAARGWTALDLERESGVDRGTVARWKTAKRAPLPETVIAIADALGVPRYDLLELAGRTSALPRSVLAERPPEISGPLPVVGDDDTDELLARLPASRRRLLQDIRESERERLEREVNEASRRFADLVRKEALRGESRHNGQ